MLLLMETFNRWRPEEDQFAMELSKYVKQLTSHETQPQPHVTSREEDGWAKGLGVESSTQGLEKGPGVLHPPPLTNGQPTGTNSHPIHIPDSSQYYNVHVPHHHPKE